MTQEQYHWKVYTRPLVIFLIVVGILTIPLFLFIANYNYLLISGLYAFELYGWSFVFYQEELAPYKNKKIE